MNGIEELKEQYWRTLAWSTRKSGRISDSVKVRAEKQWKNFDEDVVREALLIHIRQYKGYKENYTLGIMRNLQKKKELTGKVGKENPFHQFMKQDYDFEALEKEIVSNL